MELQTASLGRWLEHAEDPERWRALNPELSITSRPIAGAAARHRVEPPAMAPYTRQIVQEGYLQLPPLVPRAQTARLAAAVDRVCRQGLPPVFGFVYDEFWQLFADLARVLAAVIGPDHRLNRAGIWGWHVEADQAGWPPHRDLPAPDTLHADGRPCNLTVWIPLTDATPLNGCLYVLPTNRDPNFPARLDRFEVTAKDLQNVRALPAPAGSVLCWNSCILHWGSRSSERAEQTRISVAAYVQGRDFDKDGMRPDFSHETLLLQEQVEWPLESRLDAIRAAIRLYHRIVAAEFPTIAEELMRFAGEP